MARFTLLALAAFALAPALTSATAVADATAAPAQHSKAGRKAKHFGVATTSGLYNHYSHPKTTDVPDAVIKVAYQSYSAPAQAAVTSDAAPVDRPVSRRPYHHHYHNHHGQQTTSHVTTQTTMSPGSSASAPATSMPKASDALIVTTHSQSVAVPATTSSESTTATSSASSVAPSSTPVSSSASSSSVASTTLSTSSQVTTTQAATTTTQAATTTTTQAATTTTTQAATTTTTTSSVAATATPSAGGAGSLEQLSLDAHNALRAAHNAAPLTWNTDLAAAAQKWADKCVFQHGGGTALNAGENISGYSASSAADSNVPYAISLWSNEASLYDWNNPGYSDATGHFTQMVWKGTTELGCAQTYCTPLHDASNSFSWNGFFYVCEYLSAGNIVGQTANQTAQYFSANVQQ